MELEELELELDQPPSDVQRSSVLKIPASRILLLGLLIWPRERPKLKIKRKGCWDTVDESQSLS